MITASEFQMKLELFIPVNPKAKQSFRYAKNGIKYQPKEVTEYKHTIQSVIISQLPKGFIPFQGGVIINYRFAYPYPINMPKRFKAEMLQKYGIIYRAKKQDLDNLQKAINDAMNGLVYRDDALICNIKECPKYYSDRPGTTIIINEISNYF